MGLLTRSPVRDPAGQSHGRSLRDCTGHDTGRLSAIKNVTNLQDSTFYISRASSCPTIPTRGLHSKCVMHAVLRLHSQYHDICARITRTSLCYRAKQINWRSFSGACLAILARVSTSRRDQLQQKPASWSTCDHDQAPEPCSTITHSHYGAPSQRALKLFVGIRFWFFELHPKSQSLLFYCSTHMFHRVMSNQPLLHYGICLGFWRAQDSALP